MLQFKEIKPENIDEIKRYLNSEGELSCENDFLNLLIWQCAYNNMFAVCDDVLVIKSGKGENQVFTLPFGGNLQKGMDLIREYSNKKYPTFWAQQGKRFEEFKQKYGKNYSFKENRNAFDYIYLQSDLAELSGKRYHSKRNHISAFSKKYNWQYRPITKENLPDIKACAESWYKENSHRLDQYMQCEKQGIEFMLSNFEELSIAGGAVYVNETVVAFTLGYPLNSQVFDILVEKALSDYSEAYTVINNQFAKSLLGYKYINREDDMGLEGLRRAKLSYKPDILLKKYLCADITTCRELYNAAFYEEGDFEDRLFALCKDYCETLKVGGETVAMCFKLPCKIGDIDAAYIFAVTTDKKHRNKGYAARLIENIKLQSNIPLILRPANKELEEYYKKLGFVSFTASNTPSNKELTPLEGFKELSLNYKETEGEYTAMYYSPEKLELYGLYFPYSMQ